MAVEMEKELALLKQTVDMHDTTLSRVVITIEKISESIHDISLVLQKVDSQKDTTTRIFDEIREVKQEMEKYQRIQNMILIDMVPLKSTNVILNRAIVGILSLVGLAVIGMVLTK